MQITVNGEVKEIEDAAKVETLVALMGLDIRKVAIERNLAIVPRSQYAETPIMDGDAIEIVQFIGGG